MKFLKQYENLEQKYQFVEKVDFDGTLEGLLKVLEELKNEGCEFRGQSNALWPVVSSARRRYVDCVENKGLDSDVISFTEFCSKLLIFMKCEADFIPKIKDRIFLYDHELWGWGQHYAYSTPLIDFSQDYKVSLYMATRKYWQSDVHEGHFSIYALNGDCDALGDENEVLRLEEFIEKDKVRLLETNNDEHDMFSFKTWKDVDVITIHKDGSCKPWDESVAKERIASQLGMFVYLNRADISLEGYLFSQYEKTKKRCETGCRLQRLRCIDIPLRLTKDISALCNSTLCTDAGLGLSDKTTDERLKSIRCKFEKEICERYIQK